MMLPHRFVMIASGAALAGLPQGLRAQDLMQTLTPMTVVGSREAAFELPEFRRV